MTRNNHPIEQEELMAYLDGELATDRAVTAAAHLEHCQECQRLAADLKGLSQKMMEWEVESSESPASTNISAALEERANRPKGKDKVVSAGGPWRMLLTPRKLALAGSSAFVLLIFCVTLTRSYRPNVESGVVWPQSAASPAPTYDSLGRVTSPPPTEDARRVSGLESYNGIISPPKPQAARPSRGLGIDGKPQGNNKAIGGQNNDEDQNGDAVEEGDLTPSNGPLIVRTAALTVTVKEFDKARAALDEILKRHHGYMGELNVSVPSDAGRSLTATLRVPANQLDATLVELKVLGRVDAESQGGEEVTQQYVDLQARLANAKHMEQRLTDILRQRTGKLSDVLAVEVQIGRVRSEIERMQAEKKELTKQVQFGTLNATVKEDYKAPMQIASPSTSSRFHNAAVDGYRSVVEGFVDVLLFLLSAGPSLLVWAAILFFPARWAWRKLKKNFIQKDVPEAS